MLAIQAGGRGAEFYSQYLDKSQVWWCGLLILVLRRQLVSDNQGDP